MLSVVSELDFNYGYFRAAFRYVQIDFNTRTTDGERIPLCGGLHGVASNLDENEEINLLVPSVVYIDNHSRIL